MVSCSLFDACAVAVPVRTSTTCLKRRRALKDDREGVSVNVGEQHFWMRELGPLLLLRAAHLSGSGSLRKGGKEKR